MPLTPRNTAKIVGNLDATQAKGTIPADAERTGVGLLSVIGGEDRQEIINTDQAPWRMICSLGLRAGNGGRFVGTGWLVGPRTVITAGHCLLDRHAGQMAQIDVMPGRRGDDKPFGSVAVTSAATEVHPKWSASFDPDFDVGVIHLAEPLGDATGWFSYAVAGDDELLSHQMNVGGYPAHVQGELVAGEELWWHKDAILDTSPRRVFYATDTSGGQSGSPVWAFESGDGAPIVVGIHAYGAELVQSDVTGGSAQANSAPRIDEDIADLIDAWIAADTP
ncbi:MAG: trypsin-like peptidase domain-containing protein [Pseudomonadota bacterium]